MRPVIHSLIAIAAGGDGIERIGPVIAPYVVCVLFVLAFVSPSQQNAAWWWPLTVGLVVLICADLAERLDRQ